MTKRVRYTSMQGHNAKPPQDLDTLDDTELVQLAWRLYRVARSVVPDDGEAADAV